MSDATSPPPRSSAGLQDWGKLILRVSLGGMMLLHGIAKTRSGVQPIADMLAANGLPAEMVYGVWVGEIVAPLLLIVGLFTRTAGLVLAFNMVVAIYLAHRADVFALTEHGAWAIELQAFYLFGGLAVACLGAGRLSLTKH
jgi:putative oxidoreductase